MTNKQKAEEIAIKNSKEYLVSRNDSHKQNILFKENSIVECEKCAMEMAEWKEEQMLKKAKEWFEEKIVCYSRREYDELFEDFKQAVKGE